MSFLLVVLLVLPVEQLAPLSPSLFSTSAPHERAWPSAPSLSPRRASDGAPCGAETKWNEAEEEQQQQQQEEKRKNREKPRRRCGVKKGKETALPSSGS